MQSKPQDLGPVMPPNTAGGTHRKHEWANRQQSVFSSTGAANPMEMSSKHNRVNTTRDEYSDNVARDSISGLSKHRLSEENFVPKIDLGKLSS